MSWLNAARPGWRQCEAMNTDFHMTPFLALILAGYALFIGTLGWAWIWTKLK